MRYFEVSRSISGPLTTPGRGNHVSGRSGGQVSFRIGPLGRDATHEPPTEPRSHSAPRSTISAHPGRAHPSGSAIQPVPPQSRPESTATSYYDQMPVENTTLRAKMRPRIVIISTKADGSSLSALAFAAHLCGLLFCQCQNGAKRHQGAARAQFCFSIEISEENLVGARGFEPRT